MKDFMITMLSTVAVIFLSSFVVSFGSIVHAKCEQIKQTTNNKSLKDLISKIDYVVQVCVEATNQKFVVDKKLKGDFTEDDMDEAFNCTFKSITNMLTDEDKKLIIQNFGDFSTIISNSIESYIKQSKD